MQKLEIICPVQVLSEEDLAVADLQLVRAACEATSRSYAPYSSFSVGAALRLADGIVIQGNNQENAAYPSGLCAERTAMFYAHAAHPELAFDTLAIAAHDGKGFTARPVTPCGACRQVMTEMAKASEHAFRVLLYGTECIYLLEDARMLLPLSFDL